MRKTATITLAVLLSTAFVCTSHAQNPGQAYKSPEDCIADYSKLDTNGDGMVDNTERSKYSNIRQEVDVNGDGKISKDEMTVTCKSGIAKAFRSSN